MARQIGTKFIGTVDNLIAYKWNDIYCIRTKGNTGRQGAAAKEQSRILGLASGLSARVRRALVPLTGGTGDRKLINRLNNAIQQWLRNNEKVLTGFSFKGEPLGNYFTDPISVIKNETDLTLDIPALNATHQPPANKLTVMAVSCHLENSSDTKVYETVINMEEAVPLKFSLPYEKRDMELILAWRYLNKEQGIPNKEVMMISFVIQKPEELA